MSPVLFYVYIDDLLHCLASSGVGCFIGLHFVGALAYADDITLLAPTLTALRKMLAICDAYAEDYNIKFNGAKSECMIIISSKRLQLYKHITDCFCIGGKAIDFVKSYSHLGHIITSHLDDVEDISFRQNSFIGQVNNILCFFRKLTSVVKCKLFKAYCYSFYGCELWSLEHSKLNDFVIAWTKGVRRIWGLPYNTHSDLLPILSNFLPIFDEICRRFLVVFWFLVIIVFTMTLTLLGLLRHIVCYLHVMTQSWARMPFFVHSAMVVH